MTDLVLLVVLALGLSLLGGWLGAAVRRIVRKRQIDGKGVAPPT